MRRVPLPLRACALALASVVAVGCGDKPGEKPRGGPDGAPLSSATPVAREATPEALRAQLETLVQASLADGGLREAMDLRWPAGAYSELEVLFGYSRRNGDPEEIGLAESLPTTLPAMIREVAAGGQIEIEIRNHADGPRTPRQSDVFATLEQKQRRAMFSATFTRKGGPAIGKPSAVFLENLTLLDGRFRYMGPLRRALGLDCARLAVGPGAKKREPTAHAGLPKGVVAKTTVEGPAFDLAWSAMGDLVFIATPDGWSVWDPRWTAPVRQQRFFADWVYCATGSDGGALPPPPKDATIALGGSGKYGPDASAMLLGPDGTARLLYRAEYYAQERTRQRRATAAAISPRGELAIAAADGSVCRGEGPSCDVKERFADTSPVVAMAFTPNGERLVAIDAGGQVLAWPRLSGEPRKVALARVDRIAISPDSRFLVATGPVGMAAVPLDGEVPAGLAEPRPEVRAAAFTPRGSLVLGTAKGEVRLAEDLREPPTELLAEVGETIHRLAVDPSGGVAVSTREGALFAVALPADERADPTLGPAPIGELLVFVDRGEHPYLAGYTISGVGDPPVPIGELRRRLLAGNGQARLVVERAPADTSTEGLAILRALATETRSSFEERSPGPPGRE